MGTYNRVETEQEIPKLKFYYNGEGRLQSVKVSKTHLIILQEFQYGNETVQTTT